MKSWFGVHALAVPVLLASSLAMAASSKAGAQAPAPATAATPAVTPAPPGNPKTYVLDPKKSALVLQVFKDGAAAAFAHDHTVHAPDVSGEVIADPNDWENAKVLVTVQSKSLVNDDPQVRRQFGLDGVVPEKDKASVEESMKGPDQLDVAKFPTITFTSVSVTKGPDGKLTLLGDFTLHGVTKKMKLPITAKVDGNTLTGEGKVRFKQSDYGFQPYSAFLGAVKNKDEVVLNVTLVGVAK